MSLVVMVRTCRNDSTATVQVPPELRFGHELDLSCSVQFREVLYWNMLLPHSIIVGISTSDKPQPIRLRHHSRGAVIHLSLRTRDLLIDCLMLAIAKSSPRSVLSDDLVLGKAADSDNTG